MGLAIAVLWVAGCAEPAKTTVFKAPIRGSAHGKITLKGAPVPVGSMITFVPDVDSIYPPVAANIGENGSYSVKDIPVGKVSIMISPPPPSGALVVSSTPTEVFPQKYTSATTSEESVEIKDGEDVEYNLDMKAP